MESLPSWTQAANLTSSQELRVAKKTPSPRLATHHRVSGRLPEQLRVEQRPQPAMLQLPVSVRPPALHWCRHQACALACAAKLAPVGMAVAGTGEAADDAKLDSQGQKCAQFFHSTATYAKITITINCMSQVYSKSPSVASLAVQHLAWDAVHAI